MRSRRDATPAPNYQIRAVERALEVLSAFTPTESEMTLGRLAEGTGLHKATLVRILRCLQSRGFITQSSSGSYELGIKVFELGSVYYVTNLRVEHLARPLMERLVERWRLTANLAVLDEGQIVYVGIVEPQWALRLRFSVGSRLAVHCTALGKALVADLSEEQIDAIMRRRGLRRYTPKTIIDPAQFKATLREVREQGYSIDDQESIPNVRCVAAPIHDFTGRTVAAMSLSGSVLDLSWDVVPRIVADAQEACATISRALGADFRVNLPESPTRDAVAPAGPVAKRET